MKIRKSTSFLSTALFIFVLACSTPSTKTTTTKKVDKDTLETAAIKYLKLVYQKKFITECDNAINEINNKRLANIDKENAKRKGGLMPVTLLSELWYKHSRDLFDAWESFLKQYKQIGDLKNQHYKQYVMLETQSRNHDLKNQQYYPLCQYKEQFNPGSKKYNAKLKSKVKKIVQERIVIIERIDKVKLKLVKDYLSKKLR